MVIPVKGIFEFVINLGIFSAIAVALALVLVKLRKPSSNHHYYRNAFLVAVVMSVLAIIPSLTRGSSSPLDRLTSAERGRLEEIMVTTLRTSYLDPKLHAEFWQLMDKGGRLSDSQVAATRDSIAGASYYMRYFYEDALITLKSGQTYKSAERDQYEKRLLSLNPNMASRFAENEALMRKIANREPVTRDGVTFIFDETLVREALNNLQPAFAAVDKLFARPSTK